MMKSKPFKLSKRLIYEAYLKVRSNKGSAGIDGITLEKFEENLGNNLYRLWNRMSSGTYFPKPVMAIEIPKKNGGSRRLGIPTVEDRIAQMVAKIILEPQVEPHFHPDSYGYRPNQSALKAIGTARKRCWRFDFVIELDIKGLFDNIPHGLLMKAVKKHTTIKWLLLYIERWLVTPFCIAEGQLEQRTKGTPQGGVISPVLANLFMHYAFDIWLNLKFPTITFERYADDALIHCQNEKQAMEVLEALNQRMKSVGLELHPEKTQIVYCQDGDRQQPYPLTKFEFLGYEFRKRLLKTRTGKLSLNFTPAVSPSSQKHFRDKFKVLQIQNMSGSKLTMIAERINPIVRGWLNYFQGYCRSQVKRSMDWLNQKLIQWAMRKFKNLRGHRMRAENWIREIAKRDKKLFVHWEQGWMP